MTEQGVDVVRGIYEAFGRGDAPAAFGAMADNVEWHEAEGLPYGGVYHGQAAVAENVFGPITNDVLDFSAAPEEFIASGDVVAVVVRYAGTGRATGQKLDLPAVHVWEVRDGKIARFRQFIDTAKFREVVLA